MCRHTEVEYNLFLQIFQDLLVQKFVFGMLLVYLRSKQKKIMPNEQKLHAWSVPEAKK